MADAAVGDSGWIDVPAATPPDQGGWIDVPPVETKPKPQAEPAMPIPQPPQGKLSQLAGPDTFDKIAAHAQALWQGAKETGDPRVWWEGLKRLYNNPELLDSMPSPWKTYEEFSAGAGGDPWRAAGQVGGAAAWLGAGKLGSALTGIGRGGEAASTVAKEGEAAAEAVPGYSRWKPGTLNAEPPPEPAPPPPAASEPKPPTPAQRVSQAMSKVAPVAETFHFVPYMGWVPYLTNAVKVGADLAAKHWGWAEGGTVLDRFPSREETLRSLR